MDWNNDGRLDLITGENSGNIRIYLNGASGLTGPTYLKVGASTFKVPSFSKPDVVDWNNDGKKDVICGDTNGNVHLLLNTGTDAAPVFSVDVLIQAGASYLDAGSTSAPVAVDWNRDGKKDLIVGESSGRLMFFQNGGTDAAPVFGTGSYLTAGGGTLSVGYYSRPEVVDWDNDGWMDIICGFEDYDGVANAVYLFRSVHPPMISSVAAPSASLIQGQNVTLTAYNVRDVADDVERCTFYYDSNKNGTLEPGTDMLLGEGAHPAGSYNWTWTGRLCQLPLGSCRIFAQASDGDGTSNAPSTLITLSAPSLTGSSQADAFRVSFNAAEKMIDMGLAGQAPTCRVACSVFSSMAIYPSGGRDSVEVDSALADAGVSALISFNGDEEDVLLIGGSTAARTLTLTTSDLVSDKLRVLYGRAGVELAGPDVAMGSLRLGSSAKIALGSARTLRLGSLAMSAGARLDLCGGTMILKAEDFEQARTAVIQARNSDPRWSGSGITSCIAGENADRGVIVEKTGNETRVRLGWNGDVNADGKVDADDYFRIDSGFLAHPASPAYLDGDFNYDGKINADDYFLIDQAFLNQRRMMQAATAELAPALPVLKPAESDENVEVWDDPEENEI